MEVDTAGEILGLDDMRRIKVDTAVLLFSAPDFNAEESVFVCNLSRENNKSIMIVPHGEKVLEMRYSY